jgi:AcrR family transcriptional regulator
MVGMNEPGQAAEPSPRRGRTPSADIERELLAAAEAVLVRDGPGGLTVRAVAAEAGIAPMGVYSRLGGKDGVVNALLIKGFGRLRAYMDAAVADVAQPSMHNRFVDCGLSYRQFALDNPHFYAIMFEDAIPHERDSDEVAECAEATFGTLVRIVELAAAGGVIVAPDPVEAAQQIWSAVHGAVALELKGMVLTPDPLRTYLDMLDTVVRGMAPR